MNRTARGAEDAGEDQEDNATELTEAHALAAEVPASWLEVAADELPIEAALSASEIEEARELFAPLDANTRERIVERAVEHFLREASRPAAPPDEVPRVRRIDGRRWLARLGPPLAAAAAAASLTFVLTHSGGPEHAELTGQVRAASADRAAGETSTLTLKSTDWFYLDCRAEGSSIEIVNVRAARSDAPAQEPPRGLGWEIVAEADDGATLHAAADLPPGTWQVACDAYEPSSGRLLRLAPPASLVVSE